MDDLKACALKNPKPGHLWFDTAQENDAPILIILEVTPPDRLRYCSSKVNGTNEWVLTLSMSCNFKEFQEYGKYPNFVVGDYRDLDTVMRYIEHKNRLRVEPLAPPPVAEVAGDRGEFPYYPIVGLDAQAVGQMDQQELVQYTDWIVAIDEPMAPPELEALMLGRRPRR